MRRPLSGGALLAVLLCVILGGPAKADAELLATVQDHLYAGESAEAAAAAEAQLAQSPDDDEARLLLGGVEFIQAVENLGKAFYRYGITSGDPRRSGIAFLPIFRVPVPQNPNPEKIDYEKLRGVLAAFVDDLGRAEATLAGVDATDLDVPLALGRMRLDLNGDATGADTETLLFILQRVTRFPHGVDKDLLTDFDASDVPWLRAYCHLLMAIAEFPLAYDWQPAFETSFHGLFPSADLPMSHASNAADQRRSFASIADLIAFVHMIRWPVTEPDRLRDVLTHLEAIPPLSRENWKRVLAETDNRNEWLPNPSQTGVLGIPVTQELIDGWLGFLDDFQALLEGRKLLAHWRFTQGINLRRLLLEPTTFDLVLLIQGSAAIPYLEDGEMVDREAWRRMAGLFRGGFFRYAIWFN